MTVYPFGLEDLPDEKWCEVGNYEDYHVSNWGRVKSFKKREVIIMKPTIMPKGYLSIELSKGGKGKLFRISRLVASAFLPNPLNLPEVNHIDGVKFNNYVGNLEWSTHAENVKHATETGLKKAVQGADVYNAKFTVAQVLYIRENPDGLTTVQLAEKFHTNPTQISNVQRGNQSGLSAGSRRAWSARCREKTRLPAANS